MLIVVPNAVLRSADMLAAEYPVGAALCVLVVAAYELPVPFFKQKPVP